MYSSLSWISWPAFQTVVFYSLNDGGYDIEYICESAAWSEYTDRKWRIYRVRYLTWSNTMVDKFFAVNNLTGNEKMIDYLKWSASFIFPLVDSSTVMWYSYWT